MSSNVDAGIAETKEAWIWIVSILFGTNLQGTHGLWNERTTMSLIYGGRLILRLRRISHTVESSDTHFIVYKSVIIWGKTKRLKLTRIQKVVKKPLN